MILRTILHKYLIDDVLPAEHVQDWVDWSGEASEHFAVEHDPSTGEHRIPLVPIAAAVVEKQQDPISGVMSWLVRAQNGFTEKGVTIDTDDGSAKLLFTLPANITFWQGRFTAKWKLGDFINAAPTVAPVVMRLSGSGRDGAVWLEAPKDEDLADNNGFTPNYGGTLVILGTKE